MTIRSNANNITWSLVVILLVLISAQSTLFREQFRRLWIIVDDADDKLPLRGLFFGTSRTYGTGFNDQRHLVYPWQITSEVTNLAMCATGPQYSTMCFRTMVGNKLRVDFVVFEYNNILSGSERKLKVLAQRARARFPVAKFIFLMIPLPGNYLHLPSQLRLLDYANKQKPETFQPHLYESMTYERIHDVLQHSNAEDWVLEYHPEQTREIFDAATAVNGTIWSPFDGARKLTLEQIKENCILCFRDGNHLSINGHNQVAAVIKGILKREGVTRRDVVGKWDDYDSCHSFFQSGEVHLQHSPMNMFSWGSNQEAGLVHGKHALEVARPTSWIKIKNPTWHHLNLYIYSMSTWPKQYYPVTNLTVSRKYRLRYDHPSRRQNEIQVQISPMATVKGNIAREFHIIKGTFVGKVKPGVHYLHFQPLEETGRPFRVTGIAITAHGDDNDLQGYFD